MSAWSKATIPAGNATDEAKGSATVLRLGYGGCSLLDRVTKLAATVVTEHARRDSCTHWIEHRSSKEARCFRIADNRAS
jgi:hypothetical protein